MGIDIFTNPLTRKSASSALEVLRRIPDENFYDFGWGALLANGNKLMTEYTDKEIIAAGRASFLVSLHENCTYLPNRLMGVTESAALLVYGPEKFRSVESHDLEHNRSNTRGGFKGLKLDDLTKIIKQPHWMGVVSYPLGAILIQRAAKKCGMEFTPEHLVEIAATRDGVSLCKNAHSACHLLKLKGASIEKLIGIAHCPYGASVLIRGEQVAIYAREKGKDFGFAEILAAANKGQIDAIKIGKNYDGQQFTETIEPKKSPLKLLRNDGKPENNILQFIMPQPLSRQ